MDQGLCKFDSLCEAYADIKRDQLCAATSVESRTFGTCKPSVVDYRGEKKMRSNLLVLVFATIYAFAFREAAKTATEWGAFRFAKLLLRKLAWTFLLLIVLPVFFTGY